MPEEVTKKTLVNFYDDPVMFCRLRYESAMERQEDLAEINIENRMFYEGKDKALEELDANTRVVRSNLFVHEITPAIDTRIATATSRLQEEPHPVKIKPTRAGLSEDELRRYAEIERKLNQQLRDSGYLMRIFTEHVTGSEIYRSPSAVKVGWEDKTILTPESNISPFMDGVHRLLGMNPRKKVRWRKRDIGRPYVEWQQPDEFLYEESCSDFEGDCRYCAQVFWLLEDELKAMASQEGWDQAIIDQAIEDREQHQGSQQKDSHTERVQEERETPWEEGYKDDRYLVVEHWTRQFDHNGAEIFERLWTLANHYNLKGPNKVYKGFGFPFVLICQHNLPGTLEGLSSVDKAKNYQRVYNALFNSYLDSLSYRVFSPMVQDSSLIWEEEPVWQPGAIWKVSDIDLVKPVVDNPGPMPEQVTIINAVEQKIRSILNAEDIAQGVQTRQYEKATATKLRVVGAERRSIPTLRLYAEALIGVSWRFIALNQQYAEDGTEWIGDYTIDVPSLMRTTDPDTEKQEAMMWLAQMLQHPLFQTPLGQQKIRNATWYLGEKLFKDEVDRFVFSKEEMNAQMAIHAGAAQATMRKQQIMEQMALAVAPKEKESGVPI